MKKILLGILIGVGLVSAGLVFASAIASNPFPFKVVWNDEVWDSYHGAILSPAASQVSSFVSGADTCYILQNLNGSKPTSPVGISCVKN
jgi:hypothetical protein